MKLLINSLFVPCAVVAAAIFSSGAVAKADVGVYNQTLQSTAWVLAKSEGLTSSGSGVLVDSEKKLLITNFHVVGNARTAVIFFPEIKGGKPVVERDTYLKTVNKIGVKGRVLAVDRKRDLALIELDNIPRGIAAVKLAETSCGPGETVHSIGNPQSTEALWVYTSGTVRSVYQRQFRSGAGDHDFMSLETQSPINQGDSGGPVVNAAGELVGISQSLSAKARLVTTCVDISEVKYFLESDWKLAPLPITEILEKAELEFTKVDGDALEVSFEQTDKTKQSVFVTAEVEYFEQADVRKVWALAATLKEAPSVETTMKLLQQSAQTKLGAWSIERTRQGDFLVIYVCKIDATATPRTLKSTMEYVAKLTNLTRKDLTPAETNTEPATVLNAWLSN